MLSRFEQTGVACDNCTKENTAINKCYGGFARVAHKVREFRNKAEADKIPIVLFLNAGDSYTGNLWFILFKDDTVTNF